MKTYEIVRSLIREMDLYTDINEKMTTEEIVNAIISMKLESETKFILLKAIAESLNMSVTSKIDYTKITLLELTESILSSIKTNMTLEKLKSIKDFSNMTLDEMKDMTLDSLSKDEVRLL